MEGLTGGWVEANKLRRKQSPWPGRVCLELAGVGTRAGTIGGTIPIWRDSPYPQSDTVFQSLLHKGSTFVNKKVVGLPWWSQWLRLHAPNTGGPGFDPQSGN